MKHLVTLTLADRDLCLDVENVQDVIRLGDITSVPRAAPWIAGVMNLRGHIVTAIDLRVRLGLPASDMSAKPMCVVVHVGGEAFGLIVDAVGDVITAGEDGREPDPPTLGPEWREVSLGVVRRAEGLLLEICASALLEKRKAAA